jgi:hypothetical protein
MKYQNQAGPEKLRLMSLRKTLWSKASIFRFRTKANRPPQHRTRRQPRSGWPNRTTSARRAGIGSSLSSERIFEAKDRLATGFGAHIDPKTMAVSAAKQGMNPAIIPIMKHQVASIADG